MRNADDSHVPPALAARHALVVANGDVPSRARLDAAWPGWADDAVDVIAADGGFLRARALGLEPQLLIGDLDSLPRDVVVSAEAAGIEINRAAVDKDESDAELALLAAVRRGATRITVLGALGGARFDHALANVWLLAHRALTGLDVVLLDDRSRVFLVSAPDAAGKPVSRRLPGEVGALVSLFPHGGDAIGLTTIGLRYPLRDEPLLVGAARGLSNVRIADDAALTIRAGRLLVIEAAGVSSGP